LNTPTNTTIQKPVGNVSAVVGAVADVQVVEKMSVVRGYYELSKPGITQMIVLTASAGYYLGVKDNLYFHSFGNILHFIVAMLGTALISAGACAWNMYIEREDDSMMKRTKSRPIPSGLISPNHALTFAIITSILGAIFLFFINLPTFLLAVATHLSYVVWYTPTKKRTWTAMLVGGIPGALPALGGWTAASNQIELGGIILFVIMFIWQMPHFLSLAMMYRADYEQGGFILLGKGENGLKVSSLHLLVYSVLLVTIGLTLTVTGVTGWLYFAISLALGIYFVYQAVAVYREPSVANARKSLLASYAYLMGVFLSMFLDKV
jgi:heme o synthase